MCTLSIIPVPGGLRLVTNRDESRRRPAALPPREHDAGGVRATWPIDPSSGGTWVAANERGLILSIINLNRPEIPSPPPGAPSRGLVIPRLAHLSEPAEAGEALAAMDLSAFAPFRLVAAAADQPILEARWDRRQVTLASHHGAPLCLASSGLGDALVEHRLDLFERLVVRPGPTPARQDEFHRHRWPERPETSVLMSRAAARTVSITAVDMRRGPAVWDYDVEYRPVPDTEVPVVVTPCLDAPMRASR